MVPPRSFPAPAARPPPPGGAFRVAVELLWEDGLLPPAEPLETADALAALDLLATTSGDAHHAVAAFVVGPDVWRVAVEHALERQAHTGGWPSPLAELAPAERRKVIDAWTVFERWHDHLSLAWPIEGAHRVSSPFGPRFHPIYQKPMDHEGIDLSVPIGTPVRAAQAGKVIAVRNGRGTGRSVVIDHGEALKTSYFHLDEALVRPGDAVERGQLIARSGATGRVTGPHLHFVVELRGEKIDPALLRDEAAPAGVPAGSLARGAR